MSLDSYRQILSNKKMEIDEKMWMGDRNFEKQYIFELVKVFHNQ